MDLNKLKSDIRQHLQKRTIMTRRTIDIIERVANAVVDGDIPMDQFFEEFVPYISSYSHPILYTEERPFVIWPYGKTSQMPWRDKTFFKLCWDREGSRWRHDTLIGMSKDSLRAIFCGGISALMGTPVEISPDGGNGGNAGNLDYLAILTHCCNVEIHVPGDAYLSLVTQTLQTAQAAQHLRSLTLRLAMQPTVKLDMSGLRNLTWLKITRSVFDHNQPMVGIKLDHVELLRSGTVVLPPNVAFLELQQGTRSELLDTGILHKIIPLPNKDGAKNTPFPFTVGMGVSNTTWTLLLDGLDTGSRIVAPFKLTKQRGEELAGYVNSIHATLSWWQSLMLEHYVEAVWPERIRLSSLLAYIGPLELLSPEGCPNLHFVSPKGGFQGIYAIDRFDEKPTSGTSNGLKAEIVASWISGYIAKKFRSVEAVDVTNLTTKSRNVINGKISMIEASPWDLAAYRRYQMDER